MDEQNQKQQPSDMNQPTESTAPQEPNTAPADTDTTSADNSTTQPSPVAEPPADITGAENQTEANTGEAQAATNQQVEPTPDVNVDTPSANSAPADDVTPDSAAEVEQNNETKPAATPTDTPEPAQPVNQPETNQTAEPQATPPAATENTSQQPAEAAQADTPGNHPKKILLVEDDDALANTYEVRLNAEGFKTQRVPNGEEALSAALDYKPDLILLDVMMPKVSGFDVLDILRNTPETTNVKVIMLTALSQESDKERAKSLGVDDYLVKSQVVIADVVDKIKQHLSS
ncbi:MAG: response regulator [Candidatus Saccharibacteria bacterium]|nr:response regulator [Candidatus Saccharibacteria bacterium]